MHILCTICSDIVNLSESIYGTKCGHLFHHHCLSQWIARSKTCPQCRNKVTESCMFRMYPTAPEGVQTEDAATLQSRLDNSALQLRQQRAALSDAEEKIKNVTENLHKNEELLKANEKKLVSRESAIAALKEQLEYVKIQNRETTRLREDNEQLKKSLQTLNGLQKVLNATSQEVEEMLQGYTDIRTVATFATALKKALCEAEGKKRESRERLQQLRSQLATEKCNVDKLQAKLRELEERVSNKRKSCGCEGTSPARDGASPARDGGDTPQHKRSRGDTTVTAEDDADISVGSLVRQTSASQSPYVRVVRGRLALAAHAPQPAHALHDPMKLALGVRLRGPGAGAGPRGAGAGGSYSIFPPRTAAAAAADPLAYLNTTTDSDPEVSYDGLGGHSRVETWGRPAPPAPRLTARHRLRRPTQHRRHVATRAAVTAQHLTETSDVLVVWSIIQLGRWYHRRTWCPLCVNLRKFKHQCSVCRIVN